MKCDEVVIKIGQKTYIMDRAARNISDMVKFLYGILWEKIFGERIRVPEALSRIYYDLETGTLEVKDKKICMENRCIDVDRLFEELDKYFEAYRDRLKLLKEVEFCEE